MNILAYSKHSSGKNGWSLFLLILAGIVVGGLIGELASNVSFLKWLNFGYSFAFPGPINLDLKIMTLMLQITFDITIASIIGIGIAIFTFRKI
jgi:hypothetical protein